MPIKIGLKGIGWRYNLDKLSGMTHTMNTPFKDFFNDCVNIDVCPQWKKVYGDALKEHPNYTNGEMIKAYPPNPRWAKTGLMIFDGYLDKKFYKAFLDLAIEDIKMIYYLWKELKNITKEERKELREKFRGKLPNIERRL